MFSKFLPATEKVNFAHAYDLTLCLSNFLSSIQSLFINSLINKDKILLNGRLLHTPKQGYDHIKVNWKCIMKK
jgi:hypothetical protein